MFAMTLAVGLSGCSLPVRQPAVPKAWAEKAEVTGLPNVRYVVNGEMTDVAEEGLDSIKRELSYLATQGHTDNHHLAPSHFILKRAVSPCQRSPIR